MTVSWTLDKYLVSALLVLNLAVVSLSASAQSWPLQDPDRPQKERIESPNGQDLDLVEARLLLAPSGLRIKVANRLLVVSTEPIEDRNGQHDGKGGIIWTDIVSYPGHYLYLVNYPSVAAALDDMAVLSKLSGVQYVQPDILPLQTLRRVVEPWPLPISYNEKTFNLAKYLPIASLWERSRGKGVKIALIDIGYDPDHAALEKLPLVFSWNIDTASRVISAENRHELHGGYVAGVIWSRPELVFPDVEPFRPGLAWGIAPEAELIALKLHRPWTSNLLKAFHLAEQNGADLINISWLIPWVATPLRHYLHYLVTDADKQRGILIVAAADPQFRANVGLAAIPELLVVTSADHRGRLAASSWDNHVDLAVASYIPSISYRLGKSFDRFAKTSASVPLVTGLAALFRAIRPELTAHEIQDLLVTSARSTELTLAPAKTLKYRLLDAFAAYEKMMGSDMSAPEINMADPVYWSAVR
jgi:hypothetical protein